MKFNEDLYNDYYLPFKNWLCIDNYGELVLKNIEPIQIDMDLLKQSSVALQVAAEHAVNPSELNNMMK